MTAWIGRSSFLPQPWITGADGWAAASYQIRFGRALVLDWRNSRMLFLGIVMMPFYYISKTHSVPATSNSFRRPSRALSAFFRADTVLMERINMYSMALVMK